MEEKERYEYYLGTNSIKDNKTNQIYDYVVDLLNQQDKRIKELEEENSKLPLEQADKCEECLWKLIMAFEHNDEKPKCFNPDKYGTCQNYFKYSGIYPLFMEEYEVEE